MLLCLQSFQSGGRTLNVQLRRMEKKKQLALNSPLKPIPTGNFFCILLFDLLQVTTDVLSSDVNFLLLVV